MEDTVLKMAQPGRLFLITYSKELPLQDLNSYYCGDIITIHYPYINITELIAITPALNLKLTWTD